MSSEKGQKPPVRSEAEIKAEKRAAALRDNLKKRKAFVQESKKDNQDDQS